MNGHSQEVIDYTPLSDCCGARTDTIGLEGICIACLGVLSTIPAFDDESLTEEEDE